MSDLERSDSDDPPADGYSVAPPGMAKPPPAAARLAVFVTHGMG
jgi:hypothetical protein